MAARPPIHIGLLRGINVGGRNKLPMAELRHIFEKAGASDVQTYIQSGNVVFRASAARAKAIPKAVTAAIHAGHGLSVPVIVRSARQLHAAAKEHPLARPDTPPKYLYVGFLARKPPARLVAALDPDRSPPDVFEVRGSEIYLRYENGSARSRLTNDYFDRALETISTMRNWNTVQKLVELSTP